MIYPTLSLSLPGFSSGGGLRPQKQKVAVGTANHWGDFSVMSHWVVATLFGSPAFDPSLEVSEQITTTEIFQKSKVDRNRSVDLRHIDS